MNTNVSPFAPGLERLYSFDWSTTEFLDDTGNSAPITLPAGVNIVTSTSPVTGIPTVTETAEDGAVGVQEGYVLRVELREDYVVYTGIGKPDQIDDESGYSYVRYHPRTGEPVLHHRRIDQVSYEVEYAYDSEGAIVGMTYPSGHVLALTRDEVGRVTDISVDLGG